MKTTATNTPALNKRVIGIMGVIGVILLLPLAAMQFSDEVNWNLFDFIVAGALLSIFGLAFELALRKAKDNANRIAIIGVLLVTLFLIWAELAVGIFGTPFAGN